MRNRLKIFSGAILICFLFLGFCGCKKYPEDHQFPWHTAFHRVTRMGQLTKYVVNGIDSTSLLPQKAYIVHSGDTVVWDYNFNFYKSKEGGDYVLDSHGCRGYWNFNNKKRDLIIGFCSDPNNIIFKNIFVDCHYKYWSIEKLTNTEMHLKTVYNGSAYELFFGKNT